MYDIETEVYKDISSDVERKFDMSNYPDNHPSGIPTGKNKKVIGMMKDEAGGKQITEFFRLRSKLYSFRIDGKDEKKCKGVKKSEVKQTTIFEDYQDCLFTGNEQMRDMKSSQKQSTRLHLAVKTTRELFSKIGFMLSLTDTTAQILVVILCPRGQLEVLL